MGHVLDCPLRGLCKGSIRWLAERRVGALGVVVFDTFGDHGTSMGEVVEQGLVQELVAHPSVEALDEGVSRIGLPGAL